jgi:FixJ family two-component response regulator
MERPPETTSDSPLVVVIDDDCDSLEYIAILLDRHGIRCASFWRSREALDFIRAQPVAVVVTDVFMPEVDGVQLISAIRQCRPEAAVIALTGHNDSYLRCMKLLGAVEGISKPIDAAVLLAAVRRCLSRDHCGRCLAVGGLTPGRPWPCECEGPASAG